MRRLAFVLALAVGLAGCQEAKSFLGFGTYKKPLPGQRVSVLQLNSSMVADPALANVKVLLPQALDNPDWPQPGGYPSHAMQHLALGASLHQAWAVSIGSAATDNRPLLGEPVVGDGRVYALDSRGHVSAVDANSGAAVWQVNLAKDVEKDKLIGGGAAYDNGKLFVATPFADVVALDARTGKELWRQRVGGPMRVGPAVSNGRLFVITIDSTLYALGADDGRRLWTHSGIAQSAGLLGTTTPAVDGELVVVAYSSGEIYGLRVDTGRTLWSENLAGQVRSGAVATLADIRGRPVIDRDMVVAISHSGTMAALDSRRGNRVWDASFGGSHSPWIAGDYIFVLTNEQELLCLTRAEGHVRWVASLPKFEDPKQQKNPILWQGPVLAGDKLILTSTDGKALSVSPDTGEVLGAIDLPAPTHLPPVVAHGTVYILTDAADLIALR
jgi:outer membrane protein assembly factor BamB